MFSLALASTAATLLNYNVHEYAIVIAVAMVFSVLPDLDLHFKHRAALHNINFFLILAVAAYIVLNPVGCFWPVAIGLAAGYLGHILLDMLTVRGVAILYPFTSRRLRIARLRSGSTAANTAITILSLLLLIYSSLTMAAKLTTTIGALINTP